MQPLVLLKVALIGNALFSATCAVVMVLASQAIGAWMGYAQPELYQVLGAGLLVFAIGLVVLVRQALPNLTWTRFATLADLSWVAGTIVLLSSPLRELLSERGIWSLIVIAQMVLFCGLLQAVALGLMSERASAMREVCHRDHAV